MDRKRLFKVSVITFATICLLLGVAFLIKHYVFTSSENNQTEIIANTSQVSANKVANVSTNKPDPILNYQVEKDLVLQKKADSLLNLFDNMPPVPFFVKDERILKTGTVIERGLAYTSCEPNNKPIIFIKKAFYQKGNQKQIVNILKHELTHAWFCRQGFQVGHGKDFQKKFKSIGGFGN